MAELSISHLSKSFGSFEALSDVTIDIASGEFICLLGGSGCGKTTLLRMIAGLETQDSGKMLLGGTDVSAVPCHKRNVGMVFQSLALFPHLDVAANIAYGLTLRGVSQDVAAEYVNRLLKLVSLEGLGARQVSALSGGQRQRVAIARALALEPDVFLMDEPFSALDAALRDQMQLEIKRIQRELGVTTVFVTHDQREAMTLADRVVVLNAGRIEQAGTPDELYTRPRTRFVAGFVGSNNLLDVMIEGQDAQLAGTTLKAPEGAAHGAQTLCVRPEAIAMSQDSRSGLPGIVRVQRRLGAVLESEIEAAGQTILQHSFASAGGLPTPGASVTLSWDANAAWVLPK
jgi:putative spermidine/putrescine transport system ATP-binding protein